MSISSSLSGLNTVMVGIQTSAHNIANSNTENFKPQVSTNYTLDENQGVQSVTEPKKSEKLDITKEIVNLQENQVLYKANAKAFKIQSSVQGTLINHYS